MESRTGSRSGVEDTANMVMSNSTNVYPSTIFHDRTRPLLTNSGHCLENCTGSHLENEVTATSSKNTPSKPIRKSLRQNMVRNIKVYNKHVKKHRKELNYIKALWALRDGRNTNPVHIKLPLTHLSLI